MLSLYTYSLLAFNFSDFFPGPKVRTIGEMLNVFIPLVFIIAAIVLLSVLLWGAFKYITSGNNPESFTQAKNIIKYAILGIIMIGIAYTLTKVISYIAGQNIPI
jgi:hypothetical protein